jgi:hypothetical protein
MGQLSFERAERGMTYRLTLTRSGILESILNDPSKALTTLNGTLLSDCPTSLNRGIVSIKYCNDNTYSPLECGKL